MHFFKCNRGLKTDIIYGCFYFSICMCLQLNSVFYLTLYKDIGSSYSCTPRGMVQWCLPRILNVKLIGVSAEERRNMSSHMNWDGIGITFSFFLSVYSNDNVFVVILFV